MSKKVPNDKRGFVYSTDPAFRFEEDRTPEPETVPPAKQKLKVSLDKKQRAGKAVTLVTGFTGKDDDLQALGKLLKNFCGTGGAVKDQLVIIQGDQREKVLQWLIKNDYAFSKKV